MLKSMTPAVADSPVTIYVFPASAPQNREERLSACMQAYARSAEICLPCTIPAPGRNGRGKPCYPGLPVHFSITHSGDYWMCAFGGSPLGLDLQEHRECKKESIARRFFSEEEKNYLEADHFQSFFAVWAAKESYVKYTGEGIGDSFSRFSAADANGLSEAIGKAFLRHIFFREEYSLCLCTESRREPVLVTMA